MSAVSPAVRRGIEVMTAQGETPERIAAHYGVPVDVVKRATGRAKG